MAASSQKAYENGYRMGKHVSARVGVEKATERGSLAHIRYTRKSFVKAYDKGYWDAVSA